MKYKIKILVILFICSLYSWAMELHENPEILILSQPNFKVFFKNWSTNNKQAVEVEQLNPYKTPFFTEKQPIIARLDKKTLTSLEPVSPPSEFPGGQIVSFNLKNLPESLLLEISYTKSIPTTLSARLYKQENSNKKLLTSAFTSISNQEKLEDNAINIELNLDNLEKPTIKIIKNKIIKQEGLQKNKPKKKKGCIP